MARNGGQKDHRYLWAGSEAGKEKIKREKTN